MTKGRALVLLMSMVWLPAVARAQGASPAEIVVGYSHLSRQNSGQLFGVQGGATIRPRDFLGFTVEATAHIGEAFADKSLWTFLAGPIVSIGDRVQPFATARFGTAVSGCGRFDNGCRTAAVFSGAFGGGVHFRPGRGPGYRADVEHLFTRFSGDYQNFLRVSFGLSFPVGDR